ncbi:MAG: ABC transporter permease [Gracilimonas sp.]|uniref:ABC transporter permease n=1 Tax=Gracilimonas sp. TaxID=1974203 RepID=UPI0019A65ACE|nr:ABC transporter permease [Gracilimonas sp.]MBD3616743.1 ABC transporter permease [Gracilimonas sp.]
MLKNYLKIAFRNLNRSKGFTAINVWGLAIGLACCLLIFVYIQNELSYDRFHKNADHLYRVTFSTNEEGTPTNANGSFAVGPALKKDFPEVREFSRLRKTGTQSLVRYNQKSFYEERFFFADSTVFDLFTFPFLRGDTGTALSRPNTVVITEQTAQKYFPNEDPMGKTLSVDAFGEGKVMEFEITGVMRNLPQNSHIQFDFLASLYSTDDNLDQFAGFQQVYTYILIQENAFTEILKSGLLDFIHRNWTADPWYTIGLQPMTDIHLHSRLRSEIQPNGNIRYVQIFSVIAILVLVIACINFMNLMTARSIKRAKEVGVRKAAGAQRRQLIYQFLTESIVLSFISGILCVVMVDLFTPIFNNITGKEINALSFFEPVSLSILIGLIIAVGLLAGSYPAFILSGFKPSTTLKGKLVENGSGSFFRKGLVVFQFAISMALIAATGIVYNQLNYIQTKDLGYAEDQIMILSLNNDLRSQYSAFRNELIQHSSVINTTTSSLVPTMGTSHNGYTVEGLDQTFNFSTYFIDEHFADAYGLKLLSGENARRDVLGDEGGDFLFSEEAVKELGWDNLEEILGRSVSYQNDATGRVTGVVNDIHTYSLRDNIYASAYFVTPIQYHKYLSVRLNPNNISAGIQHIETVWNEVLPGYPFDYFFLDDSFEQMHRSDTRLAETISWFALLAIFVACLGLFGLSAYAAEQRIKEIGIRKVLGATVGSIITLFSKDFIKLIILGAIIAIPAAWYFTNNWLTGFAYRIEIEATPFVLAAIVLLIIALATISYNSIRAAVRNPVESLRNE